MDALSFGPLQQLVELLQGAGLHADTEPANVNLPGAWVTVEGVRQLTLDGQLQLECAIYLIHSDTDYTRAYEELAKLFNQARDAGVFPDGVVVPQGVVMPGNPTPMPALRVPINLI